ncbi:MAG: melibiose:sodium transporter MelB [Opitutaceae bacterium]
MSGEISLKTKFSYSLGMFGANFGCAPIYVFLMFYFTDVAGLEAAFVGTMFLVARLIDAVTDPMMGMVVDNTKTRFGKFKPWILIGAVLNSVFILALFKSHAFSGTSLYVYSTIAYILWGITYTIADIPLWSMVPALSKSRPERERLVVWARLSASIVWWLVGGYGLVTISYLGDGEQADGFFNAALGVCAIFVIGALILFFTVKEKVEVDSKVPEKFKIKDVIHIIASNDQLKVLIGCILSFNVANMMIGGFGLYYFKYVIGLEDLFSQYMIAAGLAEISGVFLLPFLANQLPRKYMWLMACSLPAISCFVLFAAGVISPEMALFVSISGGIVKFGVGMFNVLSTVMLADVVDYGEFITGKRSESIIFSAQTMLVKLAGALSAFITGVGLSLVGFVANEVQTASTILGIKVLMLGVPTVLVLISAIIYRKFYKLHDGFNREEFESDDTVAVKS